MGLQKFARKKAGGKERRNPGPEAKIKIKRTWGGMPGTSRGPPEGSKGDGGSRGVVVGAVGVWGAG